MAARTTPGQNGEVAPPGVDAGAVLGYPVDRADAAELIIGPGMRVRSGTVIYDGSVIGARLATGHNVVIREQCVLGDDVSVWSNSVIDYGCEIGDGVKIHTNCYIAQFTVIEAGAFVAPGVSVANDLYPGDDESAELMRGPIIGAGAQIGVGATLLPYVKIGAGAMVGSGAVVTRDIAPGMVAVGNPARETKPVAALQPIGDRAPEPRETRP